MPILRGASAVKSRPRTNTANDRILVAASRIGDGRGLTASLMPGADAVMMGTGFWAATEVSGLVEAGATHFKTRIVIGGEVVDLVEGVHPAAAIIEQTVTDRTELLQRSSSAPVER